MITLALETSGIQASAAILRNEQLLAESEPDTRRSAQSLAPAIETLLKQVSIPSSEIDLVAVSVGPGSFTGLRVGVTTAKMFAWAAGAEVIGVNTLDAIAQQAPDEAFPFYAVIDAHRKQIFTTRYETKAFSESVVQVVETENWLQQLQPGDTVGSPMGEKLQKRLPENVAFLPVEMATPRARTIGEIGLAMYAAGVRHELLSLAPNYYRQSAAEEKRN